jgi:hypothetical protein
VPYDDEYIKSQEALKQEAYEETYVVPPGKVIEFQDEEGHVLYRFVLNPTCHYFATVSARADRAQS